MNLRTDYGDAVPRVWSFHWRSCCAPTNHISSLNFTLEKPAERGREGEGGGEVDIQDGLGELCYFMVDGNVKLLYGHITGLKCRHRQLLSLLL